MHQLVLGLILLLLLLLLLLLTAIGLMPVGSVIKKMDVQYIQEMDIRARKQNIHLTKKQHISQNFTEQYKYNERNISYKTSKKNIEKQTKL
jgi:hypothetical protein